MNTAIDSRLRTVKAIAADTHLPDEPQIAAAFMNANVPMSVAMRSDAEYRMVKAQKKQQMLTSAGLPAGQDKSDIAALQSQQNPPSFWGAFGDVVGAGLKGPKDAAELGMKGLNALFSPLTAPIAAQRANMTPDSNPLQQAFNQAGTDVSNLATMGLPISQLASGIGTIAGINPVTPDQAADMKRAGYNPDDWRSRYAWYYDDMSLGQKAVADDDVRYFSQRYDPDKVKLVREIITSNFMQDQKLEALSLAAQKFVQGVTGDGPAEDKQLFGEMSNSSTLQAGSLWADRFGLERGSTAASVTSAVGDLATYWFADPFAGAAKGLNAFREIRYGFDASSIASAENKLMQLSKPGVADSAPAPGASRAFSNLLDTVDNVYLLQKSNQAEKLAEAAQITQQFGLRNPDMLTQFDALMAMRSGRVSGVRMRNIDELKVQAGQASKQGRQVNPFVYADTPAGKEGVPVWRFRDDDGNLLSQAEQNAEKAKVVSRMTEFIWSEAINSGRPLNRGIALLPGQVAVNRQVRSAIAPLRDALVGADKSVYKAFDSRSGIVKFDGQFDRADEMLLGDAAGAWIQQGYTGKWGKTFEKAAARFDQSFSGKTLSFTTPDGLETYRRFVTQFMPRRLAYIAVNKWAMGNPAERMAQWRQTAEAFIQAAGFKNSPRARELTDFLTKGRVARPSEADRMGPLEVYAGHRADNTIMADGHELAAGIHPYQMADGIVLPSLREIRQLQQKTGVLSAVTGAFNAEPTRQVTAAWKIGKVGNPANMLRQVIELVGLHSLEQGPRAAVEGAKARRFVAQETVAGRLASNDEARAANALTKVASGNDLDRLNKLYRSGDMNAYHAEMINILAAKGVTGRHANVLAGMNAGVQFQDLARFSGGGKTALAMAAPLDLARRVRLRFMEKTGVRPPEDSAWHRYLDHEVGDSITRSALSDLGAAKDQYAMLGNENVLDDILAASDKGIGGVPARIPNSREWLGVNGDRGAQMWHAEFDSRGSDPIGRLVQKAIALEHRSAEDAIISPGQMLNEDFLQAAVKADPMMQRLESVAVRATTESARRFVQGQMAKRTAEVAATTARKFPEGVDTPAEVAAYLIAHAPEGASLRANAYRLRYTEEGKLVEGEQEAQEAVQRLADVMVRDHAYHMGAKVGDDGAVRFGPQFDRLLDKIIAGQRVTADDMSQIPNHLRPKEISTPLYVPGVGKGDKKSIVNLASKMYGFTVARPLSRLGSTPSFIANRNVANRVLAPVADELLAKGFDEAQVAGMLEATASRYAVNATFRYTDEATEHSVFSELTDNFLMFQRASEDFIKRIMRVTSANPQILSRGYLMMEAGQHSGMIYPETTTDDDGNAETHLVMTFPGSGVLAKAVQETGLALGWGDSDLIQKPLYSSMSSQVRFINPSLSNPLGFSTSPLIGMPLRIVRSIFPESDRGITGTLGKLEGGGESFFAEQSLLQSLMPTPLARLVPALTPDDSDSQLASATRNAMIYYGAAGLLPGPMATPDEIQQAHDAIRGMATNQLVWRAIVGLFSPMAPGYNEPQDLGLPGPGVIDQVRGINSIRSEWFDVLQQATKKYGTGQGFAEASTEWLRRHPNGESILNPGVFQVGTTRAPGTAAEAGSVNSGPAVTEWMMSNKDWILKNGAVAYYLLPMFSDDQFSAAGMREQLRNGLRVHKGSEEFMSDVMYQIGVQEFYSRLKARGQAIATGTPKTKAYKDFDEWKRGWTLANPVTAAEMDRRQDPAYVHAQLAPALGKLVTSGQAPAGVPLDLARQVWQHYSDYREKYNMVTTGDKGLYNRRALNKKYRDQGDQMFLGTPVEDLWKAIDIYEGS